MDFFSAIDVNVQVKKKRAGNPQNNNFNGGQEQGWGNQQNSGWGNEQNSGWGNQQPQNNSGWGNEQQGQGVSFFGGDSADFWGNNLSGQAWVDNQSKSQGFSMLNSG
jgi:hypothetical protein